MSKRFKQSVLWGWGDYNWLTYNWEEYEGKQSLGWGQTGGRKPSCNLSRRCCLKGKGRNRHQGNKSDFDYCGEGWNWVLRWIDMISGSKKPEWELHGRWLSLSPPFRLYLRRKSSICTASKKHPQISHASGFFFLFLHPPTISANWKIIIRMEYTLLKLPSPEAHPRRQKSDGSGGGAFLSFQETILINGWE